MTRNGLVTMRVAGWLLLPIGFAITFIPTYGSSVWTGMPWARRVRGRLQFGEWSGPWGGEVVAQSAGILVIAAVVMLVGVALVVLSTMLRSTPDSQNG